MMPIIVPRSWKEEFERAARLKHDEQRREEEAVFSRHERRERDKEKLEQEQRDLDEILMAELLASPAEVAAFRLRLDRYDAATVEALLENQKALDAVQRRIEKRLMEAHVLPDGRRVFKTLDGTRVFDEHGQEVGPDIIDPDSIDNSKPRWDIHGADLEVRRLLLEEREQLLDYQQKLDAARERLDSDDITKKELERFEADLADNAPASVRQKVGLERPQADVAPPAQTASVTAVLPSNMDDLMHQTGHSPGPGGP